MCAKKHEKEIQWRNDNLGGEGTTVIEFGMRNYTNAKLRPQTSQSLESVAIYDVVGTIW